MVVLFLSQFLVNIFASQIIVPTSEEFIPIMLRYSNIRVDGIDSNNIKEVKTCYFQIEKPKRVVGSHTNISNQLVCSISNGNTVTRSIGNWGIGRWGYQDELAFTVSDSKDIVEINKALRRAYNDDPNQYTLSFIEDICDFNGVDCSDSISLLDKNTGTAFLSCSEHKENKILYKTSCYFRKPVPVTNN